MLMGQAVGRMMLVLSRLSNVTCCTYTYLLLLTNKDLTPAVVPGRFYFQGEAGCPVVATCAGKACRQIGRGSYCTAFIVLSRFHMLTLSDVEVLMDCIRRVFKGCDAMAQSLSAASASVRSIQCHRARHEPRLATAAGPAAPCNAAGCSRASTRLLQIGAAQGHVLCAGITIPVCCPLNSCELVQQHIYYTAVGGSRDATSGEHAHDAWPDAGINRVDAMHCLHAL